MPPAVAILATLDTKGAEVAELARLLTGHGVQPLTIDAGLGDPAEPATGASAQAVANAAHESIEHLRENDRRDEAMAAMGRGAGGILAAWADRHEIQGVIALGGNQGTAIAAAALKDLPVGFPKLVVSTVASGDVRSVVQDSDVAVLFSVGDLLGGPNLVTERILENAAAAIAGMAKVQPHPPHTRPAVGLTTFGNTHQAALSATQRLQDEGLEPVPFHASGGCGSAMERLIDAGALHAVLDLTTHELLAELYPDDIYTPVRPGRLTAAGRAGIPQVVVPGGLDYFCFGAPDTVPARLRDRAIHHHNPDNVNVRASADELDRVGRELAARLNRATGPTAVLVPTQGWSGVGSPGGVLHDPAADAALVDALHDALDPKVELREIDATVNDPDFAREAADTLLGLLERAQQRQQVGRMG